MAKNNYNRSDLSLIIMLLAMASPFLGFPLPAHTQPGINNRIEKVMHKAELGHDIVIAGIGGSITQGAQASNKNKRFLNLTAAWWKKKFPDISVTLVNAGIGGTGSDLGAHRACSHLRSYKPDIIIVEFAVNDVINPEATATMEGLIRQLLRFPGKPAVITLLLTDKRLNSVKGAHLPIAQHYNLPVIDVGKMLEEENDYKNLFFDDVHPNDAGHAYIAAAITTYLEKVYNDLVGVELPDPYESDEFESCMLWNAKHLIPIKNSNWHVSGQDGYWFGKMWETQQPGSTITFELVGSTFGILYHEEKSDYGIAEIRVDGKREAVIDGYFQEDWGGGRDFTRIIRPRFPLSKHKISITLLDQKNPGSNGYRFQIKAVLSCGMEQCRERRDINNLIIPGSVTDY